MAIKLDEARVRLLKITDTDGNRHISFSRDSYNYIAAPSNGLIGLIANDTLGSANCAMTIATSSVYPGTTNTVNLGTSSQKWANVYATTFQGTLNGGVKDYNSGTVTKFGYSTPGMTSAASTWIGAWDATVSGEYRLRAVKQADLRVAHSETATKLATARSLKISSTPGTTGTSFDGSADVTLVIPSTVKTFTELGTNKISSTAALYVSPASTLYLDSGAGSSLIFRPQGTEKARFDTSGNFTIQTTLRPNQDNTYSLGTSAYRWKYIYGVTSYLNAAHIGAADAVGNIYLRAAGDSATVATYGRLYVNAVGKVGDGTNAVAGSVYLTLGNSTASSTATTAGLNNAYGILRIYGTGTTYQQLRAINGTTSRTTYLRDHGATGYLVATTSTSAVGSATLPVYVNADGVVTKCNTSLGVSVTGSSASCTGNAATATAWANAQTLTLAGDLSGSVSIKGNAAMTLTATVKDDSHNHVISNVDGLQTALDNKAGGGNYIDIVVGGDANTYYPVVLSSVSSYYPMQFVNISRTYSETAPDTWNTATHRGGLTMTLLWNGSRYWDGNGSGTPCHCVYKYENYSTMVGGLGNSTSGIVVWLRGGTANYHIHSLNGKAMTATVYLTTYTDSASNKFAPKTTPDTINVRWPGYATGADTATVATNATKVNNIIPEWSGSVAWADVSWIAAWTNDGTKIKALAKNSFAAASHTHSYLPLTGGTLTGNLIIKKASWGTFAFQNESGNSLAQIAISNSTNAFDGKLTFRCYSNASTFAAATFDNAGVFTASQVKGAVWNDYAEYRESDCKDFGRVLTEKGDDTLTQTSERLQSFAGVSSDTWGYCQGETEKAKTPIAVAGRVLVHTWRNRNEYKPGDCVCAAPHGTVDIMTREEIIKYPDRIVGTVSCVPEYETWGSGDRDPVKVGNRIWIKVK